MIYYFNFGQTHDKTCKNQFVAVTEILEVMKQPTETCEILGRVESVKVGLLNDTNPRGGIFVQYGDGDQCTSGEDFSMVGSPRQTRFNIHCAKRQTEFKVDLPGGTQGTTKCLLQFTVDSPAGCPGGRYALITSSLVLFWILFIFGAYLTIGIVYNIKKNNLSGKQAIPNIEFWSEFPSYVSEGCKYSFGIMRRSYEYLRMKANHGNTPDNYSDI